MPLDNFSFISYEIYSTEFLDRELVNIYLVHHITFGKFIDKMYSDSTDAYRLNVKDEDPSADVPDIKRHKNAEVNAKLKKIEEIFKARDDKGYVPIHSTVA